MPTNRCRIEQDLGAEETGDVRRLGVPLIPAYENANIGVASVPDAKAARALVITVIGQVRVAWREIKLFVEQRIVGDVHLPVSAEELTIGVDDGCGISINAGSLPLEYRHDDYELEL